MEFSASFRRDLGRIFQYSNSRREVPTLQSCPSFRKFIRIDVSGDSFEVPTIIAGSNLFNVQNTTAVERIPISILPLYVSKDIGTFKTADSIIRNFAATTWDTRLVKASLQSGSTFYGGNGLIFDENFEPLMACTWKCHKDLISTVIKVVVDEEIVHINPKIFLDNTSAINKSILKKIIPYFLSTDHYLNIPRWDWKRYTEDTVIPTIIVDDMKNMFTNAPNCIVSDSSISDILNKFLSDNPHLLSDERR